MRPRPSEVVAGIRALLADTIEPELSSEHARSRLQDIRAVLAQYDWDEAGFALERRCTAKAEALLAVRRWWPSPMPVAPVDRTFAEYARYDDELSELATRTLPVLRGLAHAQPGDLDAATAYRALLEAL